MIYIVKFSAQGCQPCKIMNPVIESLKIKYENDVDFSDIDISTPENRQLIVDWGLTSVPTIVVIKDSEEIERCVGAMSRKDLESLIERHLQRNLLQEQPGRSEG